MRTLIVGLICLTLGVSDAASQEKILIVSRDSNFSFQPWHQSTLLPKLQSALVKHYGGEVTTHFGLLPDALNTYDALFTDLRFHSNDDSALIAQELAKLTAFLVTKGKLYIEISSSSRLRKEELLDTGFFRLAGLSDVYAAAAVIMGVDRIQGVQGRFTAPIDYRIETNPTVENAPEILFLEGEFDTLLVAGSNYSPIIGWQHEENGRHVVWHWPIVSEHYEEFIGRVVCDYFGLCEPLKGVAVSVPEKDFSLWYDIADSRLHLRGLQEYVRVELYTTLGVKLMESLVDRDEIVLSTNLPSGNYVIVARGKDRLVAKPIIVWK